MLQSSPLQYVGAPQPAPLKAGPVARQEKRIPELDGVRGLAILFVVLFHYSAFVMLMASYSKCSEQLHGLVKIRAAQGNRTMEKLTEDTVRQYLSNPGGWSLLQAHSLELTIDSVIKLLESSLVSNLEPIREQLEGLRRTVEGPLHGQSSSNIALGRRPAANQSGMGGVGDLSQERQALSQGIKTAGDQVPEFREETRGRKRTTRRTADSGDKT